MKSAQRFTAQYKKKPTSRLFLAVGANWVF